MSKKKSCGHKSSGQAQLAANASMPTTNDNLAGMEDIAHGESEGVPFILVDGVSVANRRHLEEALFKQECQRMNKTEKDCEHLHLLEYMNPPPELDALSTGTAAAAAAAMAALKAVEDELKFQADLQQLCLRIVEYKNEVLHHPIDTTLPTAPPLSDENLETSISQNHMLCQTSTNLDHIRSKLEELRQQQEKMLQAPSTGFIERPSIKRQATFDIKRVSNESTKTTSRRVESIEFLNNLQTPIEQCESCVLGDPDSPLGLSKSSISHSDSSNISPGFIEQINTSSVDPEICYIVNKIGELLMQLQRKREDQDDLFNELCSYSYIVTISPEAGVPNCIVQQINSPKLLTENDENLSVKNTRPNDINAIASAAKHSSISIYSPRLNNGLTLGFSNTDLIEVNRKTLENSRAAINPKGTQRKSRSSKNKTNLELKK